MPAVNLGPSSTQTQNVTADLTNPLTAGQVGAAPAIVVQSGLAVGVSPTGTMGANGAVTLGTALQATSYAGGIYLFYPAGAVFSGSLAGYYFTKMSSTTAGLVFNNTYNPQVGGTPTAPANPTVVVDPGPGAYTGVIAATVGPSFTVPANALGPNGSLHVEYLYSWTNSAGTKAATLQWAANTIINVSATTTAGSYGIRSVMNRGIANQQVAASPNTTLTMVNAAVGPSVFSIDTTQPTSLIFNFTTGVATDWVVLDYYRVVAYYGT